MIPNLLKTTIIYIFILLILLTNFALSTVPYLKNNVQDEDTTQEILFDQLPQKNNSIQSELNLPITQNTYITHQNETTDNFSWIFSKNILRKVYQNVIISPFSIKMVLAILLEAAGNNTKTQKELLSIQSNINQENLRNYYRSILQSLKEKNIDYTLNLETKIFADIFIQPKQRYSALLRSYYDTKIQTLQFNDSKSAVNSINDWCNNVTYGRFNHLVNENVIQNNVMLLANVIYFNGLWDSGFNNTYQGVFLKTLQYQITVQYMEQTGNFFYYDSSSLNIKILRLPYKGKKFSMFIMLSKSNNLDELINTLQIEQLKKMQLMMNEVKVKVTLPKFKFEYQQNVKDFLQELGVRETFNDNASFPGFARNLQTSSKLKVSRILQKAGIEVNEIGTKVYVSTVVEIENKFGGSKSVEEFYVNQPFLFFIEDGINGNMLFVGKVLEPFI